MNLLVKRTALATAVAAGVLGASTAGANDMDIKEIAVGILTEGIARGDRSFIEAHVAEDYIQHNPNVADGRAGILAMVDFLPAQPAAPRR